MLTASQLCQSEKPKLVSDEDDEEDEEREEGEGTQEDNSIDYGEDDKVITESIQTSHLHHRCSSVLDNGLWLIMKVNVSLEKLHNVTMMISKSM